MYIYTYIYTTHEISNCSLRSLSKKESRLPETLGWPGLSACWSPATEEFPRVGRGQSDMVQG